jgi:hypothetical protein
MSGEVKENTEKDIILTEQKKSIVISSKSMKFVYDASNIRSWSLTQEDKPRWAFGKTKSRETLKEYQMQLRILVSQLSFHTTTPTGISPTDLMIHTVLLEALRMVLVTEIFENNKKNINTGSTDNLINIDNLNLTPVKATEHSSDKGMNNITEVDSTIYDRLKVIETEFLNNLKNVNGYLKHQALSYTVSDGKGNEVRRDFWNYIYEKFRQELQEAKDDLNRQWNIFFFLNEIQSMVRVSYSVGDRGRKSRNKKLCYDIIYLTALFFGQNINPEPEDQNSEDTVPDLLKEIIYIQPPPSKKQKIADSPSKSPSKSPLVVQLKKYLRF